MPLCTVGMILPDVITPRLVVDVREHARALCVHVRRTSTPSAAIRGVTAGSPVCVRAQLRERQLGALDLRIRMPSFAEG